MVIKKNTSKYFLVVIISLFLTNSVLASTNEYNQPTIEVNNNEFELKNPLINDNGTTMIEITDLANILNLEINNSSNSNIVEVSDSYTTIVFSKNSNKAKINDKEVEINTEYNDGLFYVPLRLISEEFDARVIWNEEENTIQIVPSSITYDVEYAYQVDENARVISYDEALEMAIDNNNSLDSLQASETAMQDQRENMYNNYDIYRTAGDQNSVNTTLRMINTIDTQTESNSYTEQILKDSIEFYLINYLTNIQKYKFDIMMLEAKIELEQIDYDNLLVQNSLGLVSDNEVITAEQNILNDKNSLDKLYIMLENEKDGLNNLLGLQLDEEIYVEYEPDYDPVNVDIETYVITAVNNDPNIELLRQNVETAQYELDTKVKGETTLQLQTNLDNANRTLNDAKSSLEKNIRNQYNMLKTMEQNLKSLDLALEDAYRNYYNAKSSYLAGMATVQDLNKAKLAILNAQVNIEKNHYDYALQKYLFEHTDLLGS